MKTESRHWMPKILVLALLCSLLSVFPTLAANLAGELETVDNSHITGWAWNVGSYDDTVDVELHIYKDGSSKAAKVITVSANQFSASLGKSIGDGYHYFDCPVDWSKFNGSAYKVEAYAVFDGRKVLLEGTKEYKPVKTVPPAPEAKTLENRSPAKAEPGKGPGNQESAPNPKTPKQGRSLGMFTTTGYCSCSQCCGSNTHTYSGTIPQPKHTISADINVFPIGTKLMINGTVYTVEDIGSGVNGNKLDIFYATHEEALAHGVKTEEVFAVEE